MALTPGTRLGPFEVTALLGAGGMGQVYRATDTNLKRQVAIKVLPAPVAADADRLARFQREAEVLAALNHPHIAAIHGLEKTPEFTALVMELVEGEDLSQRIARGAVPIDEALPIAKQIAEALEAAHEQGIIHRDLKPANIKIRPDGTVKVLDFGLAKALDPAAASSPEAMNSPTITTPAMTQAGMILGTAAYMAPDGRFLAFVAVRGATGNDLMILPMEGDGTRGWTPGTPTAFLSTPGNEASPMFSPDGRWIACRTTEASAGDVYVRPFPGPGGQWRISTTGGGYPQWSATTPELLSIGPTQIMAATYAVVGDAFRADTPQTWSPARVQGATDTNTAYDLHPDGKRVAAAAMPELSSEVQDKVVFVFNFGDHLRTIAPGNK